MPAIKPQYILVIYLFQIRQQLCLKVVHNALLLVTSLPLCGGLSFHRHAASPDGIIGASALTTALL